MATTHRVGPTLLAASLMFACASYVWAADPVLKRGESRDWILWLRVEAQSYPLHILLNDGETPGFDTSTAFDIDSATFIYPMIKSSASSESHADQSVSSLSVDGVVYDTSVTLLPDYQAGERLGRWELPKLRGNQMRFELSLPMTTYAVSLDESRARRIPWPKKPWPAIAASALQPQLFVESDDDVVRARVRQWTRNNPGGVAPALLAKILAARVIESFRQDNDPNHVSGRQGEFAGVLVKGAARTARDGFGSPTDLATYLCAVYRAAGLPARLVVGYDIAASLGGQLGITDIRPPCEINTNRNGISFPILRTWVEFYLYDEADQRGEWIPVDIYRQFQISNRPPSIDQRWDFFGDNACLKYVAPISFHLHPPTTVVNAGPPALWGWLPLPSAPVLEQRLDFGAREPTTRGRP